MSVTFDLFALQLFAGLALGSVFVLLAVGLSLIFGLLTVVNFAHGAFYTVGAYVGVFLLGLTGNFWLTLGLVPIVVGAMGLAVERFLVRPLYGRGHRLPAAADLRPRPRAGRNSPHCLRPGRRAVRYAQGAAWRG